MLCGTAAEKKKRLCTQQCFLVLHSLVVQSLNSESHPAVKTIDTCVCRTTTVVTNRTCSYKDGWFFCVCFYLYQSAARSASVRALKNANIRADWTNYRASGGRRGPPGGTPRNSPQAFKSSSPSPCVCFLPPPKHTTTRLVRCIVRLVNELSGVNHNLS